MKTQGKPWLPALVAATAMVAVLGAAMVAVAPSALADEALITKGKEIALHRQKGNCMACHQIAGVALPGNIGPPLLAMKARYPDKAALRADIWDITQRNPHTMMPPFGKHGILTDEEVDAVTEYIHTL